MLLRLAVAAAFAWRMEALWPRAARTVAPTLASRPAGPRRAGRAVAAGPPRMQPPGWRRVERGD
eukprot:11042296-Alexandrium_andersonii.AAC.1